VLHDHVLGPLSLPLFLSLLVYTSNMNFSDEHGSLQWSIPANTECCSTAKMMRNGQLAETWPQLFNLGHGAFKVRVTHEISDFTRHGSNER